MGDSADAACQPSWNGAWYHNVVPEAGGPASSGSAPRSLAPGRRRTRGGTEHLCLATPRLAHRLLSPRLYRVERAALPQLADLLGLQGLELAEQQQL